jgi:hypothetical protein
MTNVRNDINVITLENFAGADTALLNKYHGIMVVDFCHFVPYCLRPSKVEVEETTICSLIVSTPSTCYRVFIYDF